MVKPLLNPVLKFPFYCDDSKSKEGLPQGEEPHPVLETQMPGDPSATAAQAVCNSRQSPGSQASYKVCWLAAEGSSKFAMV
jgi:hypothetical protein